nr:MAG TPA: hypothetical protein [Caudoviricetes sp.]DAU34922.1 MAG TPA: hypothetical protein [Caudoviricetes sp.]
MPRKVGSWLRIVTFRLLSKKQKRKDRNGRK